METARFPMIDYHLDVFHWLAALPGLPVATHSTPDVT